jgi:hypothetical protein
VEKNMGLRQHRVSGPKEGCFDNREKKNGCEKTRLKLKEKRGQLLKRE